MRPVCHQLVKGKAVANNGGSKEDREHDDPDACDVAVTVRNILVEAVVGAKGKIFPKVKSYQIITLVNFHCTLI